MFGTSLRSGFAGLRARPGLIFLLFGLNLALGALLAVPIATWLGSSLADTGFDPDLYEAFDMVLFADLVEAGGSVFSTLIGQVIWILPLYLLWSVASRVGLVEALRDGAVRSFWTGVSRYTGRAILLALLYLVLIFVWTAGTAVVAIVGNLVFAGEVAGFWFNGVAVPSFWIFGLAAVDQMHDYGRATLVIEEQSVTDCWLNGIRFVFRNPVAAPVYIAWFALGLIFLAAPTTIEILWGSSLLVFMLQQVFLLGRTAVTVGWIGSEVALFESVRLRAMPLLADDEGAVPGGLDSALA